MRFPFDMIKRLSAFLLSVLTVVLCFTACSPQKALYSPLAQSTYLSVSDVAVTVSKLSAFYDLELNSEYAIVYDVNEQKVLFAKGSKNDRVYPASLTKLYTSYVALKYIDKDEKVTVGADELALVRPYSSMAYLGQGARISVETVIEGMMLPSGNDAAQILATAAGRKIANDPSLSAKKAVELFVKTVNENMQADGIYNSHFANPDGYHDDAHYTTLADLLMMAKLAMNSPVISKYTGLYYDRVSIPYGITLSWYNTNRLISPTSKYYVPEAIGLKTGSTNEAGYCLASAAKFGDRTVIVITLKCEKDITRFDDALKLLYTYRDLK